MLVRAVKPNFDCLHEAAKQLLIWTFSTKQSIHTCQINDCYSRYKPFRRQSRWDLSDTPEKSIDLKDLEPIEKNIYVPHPNVQNRPESEIQSFYEKHTISFFGKYKEKCPAPILSFEELNVQPEIQNVISNLNYTEPTPIQSVTWPVAFSGLNMAGIAPTGGGKTLGFTLPGLTHVKPQLSSRERPGPNVVVLSPTRELAQQTNNVFLQFSRSCSFQTACIFGGVSRGPQSSLLQRAQVCIATPGRLIDFLREGCIDLRRCTYFVLDEADRLLDIGFEPQINRIMSQLRPDSQILMWSATWPDGVKHLASEFLKDFVGVRLGTSELSASPNITQNVHVCNSREKDDLLLKILEDVVVPGDSKTLIFAQTKYMVSRLQDFLNRNGFDAGALHGDLSQQRRNITISKFRSGRFQILVGTLVVGRGLDISNINNVIIYDFPTTIEDYVHVIGRTGRVKKEGTSHTFFTSFDSKLAGDLIKVLNQTNQTVNPDLLNMAEHKRLRNRRYERGF